MLFIKHNSSTLYWQLEVKMAFIQHKARAHKRQSSHHNDTEYTEVRGVTWTNVGYFSLIIMGELSLQRVKVKCEHTFPSKTISYPSLSLILLYRYSDSSRHLSIWASNPMVPCREKISICMYFDKFIICDYCKTLILTTEETEINHIFLLDNWIKKSKICWCKWFRLLALIHLPCVCNVEKMNNYPRLE